MAGMDDKANPDPLAQPAEEISELLAQLVAASPVDSPPLAGRLADLLSAMIDEEPA